MPWQKINHFSRPINNKSYFGGRAPVPLKIKNDIYRIFFGGFDKQKRCSIFSIDININDSSKIFNINNKPVYKYGKKGYFDDNGIIPSDIIKYKKKIYLITSGFSVKNKYYFDASSGIIKYDIKKNYFKRNSGTILDRNFLDCCWAASPTIKKINGKYVMFYVSCFGYKVIKKKYTPIYNIKIRISDNIFDWSKIKKGKGIFFKNKNEFALARPTIIFENKKFHMWFCFRDTKNNFNYRLGYAYSKNGMDWKRDDLSKNNNLTVSNFGWDSDMICYPYVFKHKNSILMLYNGNEYGRTGFGLAKFKGDLL